MSRPENTVMVGWQQLTSLNYSYLIVILCSRYFSQGMPKPTIYNNLKFFTLSIIPPNIMIHQSWMRVLALIQPTEYPRLFLNLLGRMGFIDSLSSDGDGGRYPLSKLTNCSPGFAQKRYIFYFLTSRAEYYLSTERGSKLSEHNLESRQALVEKLYMHLKSHLNSYALELRQQYVNWLKSQQSNSFYDSFCWSCKGTLQNFCSSLVCLYIQMDPFDYFITK